MTLLVQRSTVPVYDGFYRGSYNKAAGILFKSTLWQFLTPLFSTLVRNPGEGAFNTNGANGQTKTVIDLFFNVLRALFLLYVAISLVRVVQAFRNDEDWQTLSRTPLIIVMAVTVGDIITSMIVKTG